jgi:hypothetical protein
LKQKHYTTLIRSALLSDFHSLFFTMATTAEPAPSAKFNFPGPIGTKRRRMRSGGNVSTMSNNTSKSKSLDDDDDDDGEPKTTQTSKCKGATTIPIFLKSKYKPFQKQDLFNAD